MSIPKRKFYIILIVLTISLTVIGVLVLNRFAPKPQNETTLEELLSEINVVNQPIKLPGDQTRLLPTFSPDYATQKFKFLVSPTPATNASQFSIDLVRQQFEAHLSKVNLTALQINYDFVNTFELLRDKELYRKQTSLLPAGFPKALAQSADQFKLPVYLLKNNSPTSDGEKIGFAETVGFSAQDLAQSESITTGFENLKFTKHKLTLNVPNIHLSNQDITQLQTETSVNISSSMSNEQLVLQSQTILKFHRLGRDDLDWEHAFLPSQVIDPVREIVVPRKINDYRSMTKTKSDDLRIYFNLSTKSYEIMDYSRFWQIENIGEFTLVDLIKVAENLSEEGGYLSCFITVGGLAEGQSLTSVLNDYVKEYCSHFTDTRMLNVLGGKLTSTAITSIELVYGFTNLDQSEENQEQWYAIPGYLFKGITLPQFDATEEQTAEFSQWIEQLTNNPTYINVFVPAIDTLNLKDLVQ